MEKLLTRKETAKAQGISLATQDSIRNDGLISYIQYVDNGCVYFTETAIQEYIARATHRVSSKEGKMTYRSPRRNLRR